MEQKENFSEDEVASKLFSACSSGDLKALKALYQREPRVHTLIQLTNTNETSGRKIAGKTLYVAVLRGHYEVAHFLLKKGANMNADTGSGTIIYAAVRCGSLDMVTLLVSYHADYQITGDFSPVYVACVEGKLDILKFLVSIGADLFAFNDPPLVFTACSAGHLSILEYLMEETNYDIHRTVNGDDALKTDGKDTLLYAACQMNRLKVARYLVEQGAYVTQTIMTDFPRIAKALLQEKIRPVRQAGSVQRFQAALKDLGLGQISWTVLEDFGTCLTHLDLHSNYLMSIPNEIFQLPMLKSLDISQNLLPQICQEDTAWGCHRLVNFNASHNQITVVPDRLFHMPELGTINISHNLLSYLPVDTAESKTLSSSGLSSDVQWYCKKLKCLDLSHNRLYTLPDVFSDLHQLSILRLSHNLLNELPQSCCWGCINLVELDASNNQLSDLPVGAASYWMHSLEHLHLSHNRFVEITQNITELSSLIMLDMSFNDITTLPPTSWWTGSLMNKLNLSNNRLTVLSHKPVEPEADKAKGDRVKAPGSPRFQFKRRNRTPSPKPPNIPIDVSSQQSEVWVGKNGRKEVWQVIDKGQPRELPVELWSKSLQCLYLQRNKLKYLPRYIGKLVSLTCMDISYNPDIKCLPLSLGQLHNCWELILQGLTICNVPPHLMPSVRGGSAKRMLAYLRMKLRHCEPYNRMKLMAVGLQGRGKSTLISVLRNPSASLPKNISTVGVEVAEWVMSPPPHVLKEIKKGQPLRRHQMDITFSTWDLAGQEVYYATHQCFLSRNTLYVLVWSMEEGEKGISYLRPWLLNIQSRAPHSPVLIVGTHLDKFPASRAAEVKRNYEQRIKTLYGKPGYPRLTAIEFVSCVTREGIRDLQDRVHHIAISTIDPDTREHIVGMQVPASYIHLQRLISEEVRRCQEREMPPVLSQKEFAALADRIPHSDISDPEELSLAAQFLHDYGVLLHYNDHLRGLNNLYFIDPVWLADLLAEVITVPQRQNFVSNGILKESDMAFIFRDSRRFPSRYFSQYLQLFERFQIALSLGSGQWLIPSLLSLQQPALSLPSCQPPKVESIGESKSMHCSNLYTTRGQKQPPTDRMRVIDQPTNCIRRRYHMAYTPSGFWSRLISRLIINLKRSGLVEENVVLTSQKSPPIVYWRRGIAVVHSGGQFVVQSIHSPKKSQVSGTTARDLGVSAKFFKEEVDLNIGVQGVDITVWSSNGDFSAMGYIVDHLDSLIDEWFPGLKSVDVGGEWLVQRQVLWRVPAELLEQKRQERPWRAMADDRRSQGEPITFQLETCAGKALTEDTIICPEYKVRIPLRHLVPDLFLTDLPWHFYIDYTQVELDFKNTATHLSSGGAGVVCRGKYRHHPVAIKMFLTAAQVEHLTGNKDISQFPSEADDDVITSGEALFMFRDLRNEVTLLAQLDHPYIVALLGVSIHPMCMVVELAPLGNLFDVLTEKVEQLKEERASASLRMYGGVLGHELSTKVALQVALALRYLHSHGVVYRDLKSDNVLVWSLDLDQPVNIKLADNGISRFANPGGVKGEEGTAGYLAPEAIQKRGEDQAFDEKVDIFSFAMLLFEILTGQRPFQSLTTTEQLNSAVAQGKRPVVTEGNLNPAFPAMIELMNDCWKQSAAERPSAGEVVQQICEPGFLCRKHTVTKSKDHPLQKIDTIYSPPICASDVKKRRYHVWTWSRQDKERNFSLMDVRKGVFRLSEKSAHGGRVLAMTTTEERVWIGTADCEIQVFGNSGVEDPQCLWTFFMKDSVLALNTELEDGKVKRVFASLANGTLCIFSRRSTSDDTPFKGIIGDAELIPDACIIQYEEKQYQLEAEEWASPLFLKLDKRNIAAKCMVLVGNDRLWCGCGNTITVVDIANMVVIKHIPVFVRRLALVNVLVSNGRKVWGVGRQLSCVMEWDVETYNLLHIFNCWKNDSTGENIQSDPAMIEDLINPHHHHPNRKPPESLVVNEPKVPGSFSVHNDPTPTSAHAPYSCTRTRQTLRSVTRKFLHRRPTGSNLLPSNYPKTSHFQRLTVRSRLIRNQQGSTRITSLVIVDKTLWVGRGMGDILIIDISEDPSKHGTVLARLAMKDCEKFGSHSYHKLQYVAGEYVVSSQWLEPIDVWEDSSVCGSGQNTLAGQLGNAPPTTHQTITVWDAWNWDTIQQFMQRQDAMLQEDMCEEEEDENCSR